MIKHLRRLVELGEQKLARHGYIIQWMPPSLAQDRKARLECELEFVIAELVQSKSDIFFVAIGANDGVLDDPLFPFVKRLGWRGVVIEPVPETCARLAENYRDYADVEVLNVALHDRPGTRQMFSIVDDTDEPSRASHFASFDYELVKQNIQRNLGGRGRIVQSDVKCITMGELFEHVRPNSIDILQIDAEGYDFKILQSIDFRAIRPKLINFEHASMSKAQQEVCARRLIEHGYRVRRLGRDTLAYGSGPKATPRPATKAS